MLSIMMFDPKTKSLRISADEAASAGRCLLSAILYFREAVGLDLAGYEDRAARDTCEYCILKAAAELGIDLGAELPGKIDVRAFR